MPAKKTTNMQVSSPSEWRKGREEGVLFHFPSGMKAMIRPVSISTFIAVGKIPDLLTGVVEKLIASNAPQTLPLDDMRKALQIYDIFCQTSFVYPRIVDEVKDPENEITAGDISDSDKQTLFAFLGSPASALAAFRPFQADTLADLGSEQGNRESA